MDMMSCGHVCLQEVEDAVGNWWKRSPELWQSGELLLACGATAVADLRAAVAAELDYSCSAGIAHNKASTALPSSTSDDVLNKILSAKQMWSCPDTCAYNPYMHLNALQQAVLLVCMRDSAYWLLLWLC